MTDTHECWRIWHIFFFTFQHCMKTNISEGVFCMKIEMWNCTSPSVTNPLKQSHCRWKFMRLQEFFGVRHNLTGAKSRSSDKNLCPHNSFSEYLCLSLSKNHWRKLLTKFSWDCYFSDNSVGQPPKYRLDKPTNKSGPARCPDANVPLQCCEKLDRDRMAILASIQS